MDYLSFIPSELLEIVISFLYINDLSNLLLYNDIFINIINWTTVNNLHFNSNKISITYYEYFSFVSIEKIKSLLTLR